MRRIVVGISGASGAIYGIRLVEVLREVEDVETHLVISRAARRTIALETESSVEAVEALADCFYRPGDIAAAISSGSFRTDGMVVAPCSMRTVSGIATSHSDDLLLRAADVTLKERRRLVLLVRETPLHLGHLRLLVQVAEIGAEVMPPVPAFYHRPTTIADLVDQTVNRALDRLDVELPDDLFARWRGVESPQDAPQPQTIERTRTMASLSHSIRIKAPRDQVYEALTTVDGLRGWNTPDIDGDVTEGSEFTLSYGDGAAFRWGVVSLVEGKSVGWECLAGPGQAEGSKVTFELADTGEGRTAVELEHSGWPEDHEALSTCNTLWGVLLGRLRSYIESETAQPALT